MGVLAENAESPKTSTEVPEFNAWWLSSVDLRYLMVAVLVESLQREVLALGLRTQWDFFFKKQFQGRSFCVWLGLIGFDGFGAWGTFWDVFWYM